MYITRTALYFILPNSYCLQESRSSAVGIASGYGSKDRGVGVRAT
jgi:hypothetical protein